MRTFKQFFILSVLTLSTVSFAQTSKTKFTLEPIYGVETRMVRYPEPARYTTDVVYGARILYGVTLLSGEAEYTTTHTRNDYPSRDLKVEDKAERLSLGIRTTLPMNQYIGTYFRIGGRASRGESILTTTSTGQSESKDNPLRIDPYGGAGIQIAFHNNFALNAGATLIRNAENKFDAQYTLGLSARFGNR